MKLGTIVQQPSERRTYTITYEDSLTAGDNLKTAVVKSIAPDGLVVDQVTLLDPRVRFFVSGGVDQTSYKVTFTVATEDSQVFEDEITVKIKED
jgi:hypothetical protein